MASGRTPLFSSIFSYLSLAKAVSHPIVVCFDCDVSYLMDDKTILASYWTILQKRLR